jgi:hypothetical protein
MQQQPFQGKVCLAGLQLQAQLCQLPLIAVALVAAACED